MKRRMSSTISRTGGSPSKDCDIMASGSTESPAAPESSDATEESTAGKKKSRFQTFKNFFVKKKWKDVAGPVTDSSDAQLKYSHSTDDVNIPEPTTIQPDKDSDNSSNINTKALSQDSVFTSDPPSPETNQALQSSQDSIHGKVKSLQMQLKQAIRFGSPQTVISMKKCEDGGVSEDDGLPSSPPEYSTTHAVLTTSSQRSSDVLPRSGSISLEGSDSDEDQMSGASSRPCTPQTSIPVDFSEPASSLSCLDSSAAHHRIAVKSRACAKRKPASREMLQPKKRDLRERLLLRDTEDKLRASRTSKGEEEEEEEEENRDNVLSEGEIIRKQQGSTESPSILTQNQRELPPSSPSQRSSTTTSASEEASEDEEHVASSGILEPSWETLELNTDDFLLDAGCEVVSDEKGSLLEEVLSSLKGPLVSGLVLDMDTTAEQIKVKDTAGNDVLYSLAVESTTEQPDSIDASLILDEQEPVENTLSESVTFPQGSEQENELPEEQALVDCIPFKEDLHVMGGLSDMEVYTFEEEEHDRKDLIEEMAEDSETMNFAGENLVMEREDEDPKIEESLNEEVDDDDAEEESDQEEWMLVGDDQHSKDKNEEEEENEAKSQETCLLEEDMKLDTSINIESLNEIVEGRTSVSTKVVNQPEDLIATEQPSFVVMTSVQLSFPRKTSPQPKETEDVPKILQEVSDEQHDSLDKCEDQPTESLQINEEHSENVHPEDTLTESHQASISECEVVEESIEEISQNAGNEGETQSLPSSPSSPFQKEICQTDEDTTLENPFGVRLRKTPIFHRYVSEGDCPTPVTEPAETPKSHLSRKPVVTKKPDQGHDGVVKSRKTSDLVGKELVEISKESPSWISLARQKQKVFKENSLDESLGESKISAQEEFSKKGLLDEPSVPVVSCSLEISKPVLEKRIISHTVPAPLTQDEPPWLALAKKKAKAWSEMPQIVQ